MRPRSLRIALPSLAACLAAGLAAGCGGKGRLLTVGVPERVTISSSGPTPGTHASAPQLVFPELATKNTTRIPGADPIADAAAVSLAVYPSAITGTHPAAVVLAPTDNWEAALAASVLMARPLRAPLLLAGRAALPVATAGALKALAPTGASALNGGQVIRVGDVPPVGGMHSVAISASGPFGLPAAIDRFWSAAAGKPSNQVVIASADSPAYALPAAGWAAESGDPLLFVTGDRIPAPTAQALVAHQHPNIYVLGPPSVVPDSLLSQLARYGPVKRVGGAEPVANAVAFAVYRDPPCPVNQPCVHVPGSFGWALTSPGHGYTLINAARPLDAAAAAPLSASGQYGPELLLNAGDTLPVAVQDYLAYHGTPGFDQAGPTAAVYNHGWVIGDAGAVSLAVQAEIDSLLEPEPVQR